MSSLLGKKALVSLGIAGVGTVGFLALIVLVLPPAAVGDEFPLGSMRNPEPFSIGWAAQRQHDGSSPEPGEPFSPGFESDCSGMGGLGEELENTDWYYFVGTGQSVVVRADGEFGLGFALYEGAGQPTADEALACPFFPPHRFDLQTKKGEIYKIQVGDWEGGSPDLTYRLAVVPATSHGTPETAIKMELGDLVEVGNWGAPSRPPGQWCQIESISYGTDRSAWGLVEVPAPGTLHIEMRPTYFYPFTGGMILLYPVGQLDRLSACSPGPPSGTSLDAYLPAGSYWVQFTRPYSPRLDFEGSVEETWQVSANFDLDLDLDRDGSPRPADCDDGNPSIHPGAEDLPDDGVDANCDGADSHRDSDGDLIPDYMDRCPHTSSGGVDANHDGCADPRQLHLVVQTLLTLRSGGLHVRAFTVRSDPGAQVVLQCDHKACSQRPTKLRRKRMRFEDLFQPEIPGGTEVVVSATKTGYIGESKRYRLSRRGVRLLRDWCTAPGNPKTAVECG